MRSTLYALYCFVFHIVKYICIFYEKKKTKEKIVKYIRCISCLFSSSIEKKLFSYSKNIYLNYAYRTTKKN